MLTHVTHVFTLHFYSAAELGVPDHDGGAGVLHAVPGLVPLPGLSVRHIRQLRDHHWPAHVSPRGLTSCTLCWPGITRHPLCQQLHTNEPRTKKIYTTVRHENKTVYNAEWLRRLCTYFLKNSLNRDPVLPDQCSGQQGLVCRVHWRD